MGTARDPQRGPFHFRGSGLTVSGKALVKPPGGHATAHRRHKSCALTVVVGLCRPRASMGSVSYQLEKGPTKGLLGLFVYGIYFFVYGIYFSFISAAVIALAGFIAAALAVMLLASLLSAGVALWRRHVWHELGSFGE